MEKKERKNGGLFLSDLIALAKKQGVEPENLFLTLCVDEVESHTTRIARVVIESDTVDGVHSGLMWLHLDPSVEQIVNKATADSLEWESVGI